MQLARVVGTVVSTQKSQNLTGVKLLILEPLDPRTLATVGKPLVAVDGVGAGEGEVVLYVAGSSARLTERTKDKPVDATIMAIVDFVEVDGKQTFAK
ncbi:MAG: EutN/CcmL family microcompartment protein [Polyangia bacterium]|jgi:microcompartment protein CcmK/EutM|nr:EutN/CcmL family microcompartment protein [Polyangia bacterium]